MILKKVKKAIKKKIDNKGLNINIKRNKTIWGIYNENIEEKYNTRTKNTTKTESKKSKQKKNNSYNNINKI